MKKLAKSLGAFLVAFSLIGCGNNDVPATDTTPTVENFNSDKYDLKIKSKYQNVGGKLDLSGGKKQHIRAARKLAVNNGVAETSGNSMVLSIDDEGIQTLMQLDPDLDVNSTGQAARILTAPEKSTLVEVVGTEKESTPANNAEGGESSDNSVVAPSKFQMVEYDANGTYGIDIGSEVYQKLDLSIYANGVKLTTARFNYYVSKALTSGEVVKSQDEYPILQKLLTQLTLISDAEQMRNEAESLRVTAENERVSVTAGIVAQVQALASQAMNYAKAAQDWYTLLVAYAGDLSNVDLTGIATKQDIAAAIAAIDCGLFTGSSAKVIQMRRGSAENMPALSAGECGFDVDSGLLYIGNGTENILINGSPFIAQATAPDNVNKIWIDTANGNSIKYYDGTKWTGTATATFG